MSLANHELGTVQDVAALANAAHRSDALFHCDASQAFGKLYSCLGLKFIDNALHDIAENCFFHLALRFGRQKKQIGDPIEYFVLIFARSA